MKKGQMKGTGTDGGREKENERKGDGV